MNTKPYRIKVFDDAGRPTFEITDRDPRKLFEKTEAAFKRKFA